MTGRKLVLKMVMSLDGFVTSPDGTHEWMFEWFGEDSGEWNRRALDEDEICHHVSWPRRASSTWIRRFSWVRCFCRAFLVVALLSEGGLDPREHPENREVTLLADVLWPLLAALGQTA